MLHARRRLVPSSLGTILLLGLALVLVGVLVYQAQDAARSQQRIAEATLNDYASFADWQLTQQAKSSVLSRRSSRRLSCAGVARRSANVSAKTIMSPEQVGGGRARDHRTVVPLSRRRALLLSLRLVGRNVPHDGERSARRRDRVGSRHHGELREVARADDRPATDHFRHHQTLDSAHCGRWLPWSRTTRMR